MRQILKFWMDWEFCI